MRRGVLTFAVVTRSRLATWVAVLALGGIVGAAAATVWSGRQLDELMRQREALMQRASDLQERMQKLEQSLSERRRRPIQNVDVRLSGLDAAEESALRHQVRQLLQGLVGRPVDQVDPDLVAQILNGRLVDLNGRAVQLFLRSVWVTDTLTAWIEVRAAESR